MGGYPQGYSPAPVRTAAWQTPTKTREFPSSRAQLLHSLPEFRPPVFVGNLPKPDSPEAPGKSKSPETEVRQLQRRVAELEREKVILEEDQLRTSTMLREKELENA